VQKQQNYIKVKKTSAFDLTKMSGLINDAFYCLYLEIEIKSRSLLVLCSLYMTANISDTHFVENLLYYTVHGRKTAITSLSTS